MYQVRHVSGKTCLKAVIPFHSIKWNITTHLGCGKRVGDNEEDET